MKKNSVKNKFFGSISSTVAVVALCASLSSCYGPARESVEGESYSDRISSHYGDKAGGLADADRFLSDMFNLNQDMMDPSIKRTRGDFEELFADKKKSVDNVGLSPKLANVSKLLTLPKKPVLTEDNVVTISITDDVPLRDAFIELSRRSGVDMEIDHNITGGIIFSATERPFSEVIERMAKMANLVYSMEDNVVRVSMDYPKIVNYSLNLLNMVRSASGDLNVGNQLGTGDAGISNGSSNALTVATGGEGDIWATIQRGVNNILVRAAYQSTSPFAIAETKRMLAVSAAGGGRSGGGGASASGGRGAQGAVGRGGASIISLNRSAGVISILATNYQHNLVKEYLDYIHMFYTSQVLIEAKVVEVTLKDEFRNGVDWTLLTGSNNYSDVVSNFNDLGFGSEAGTALTQTFGFGVLDIGLPGMSSSSLSANIEMVEAFGTTRTLSSPRLHAMNNQFAVLSFATNRVYFVTTIEEESDDTTSTLTIASEPRTVPIGVTLNIMPSIDLVNGEIMMNVRPTLTRIGDERSDPAVALRVAQLAADTGQELNISSSIPEVDVRELDTVLKIKDGQVMVIGGLLNEVSTNADRGIPGISKIPFFGNAFKSVQKINSIVETVIFLKATIVPGAGVSVEDRDFYRNFTRDRHPLDI